ncbi:uncharacterized protein LOC122279527 [Carya illinoinensis]|uniref:uncharacterized protein LOC122279527 n=1 Tax=Carya illinoinensis TaxID=32201 RepID=UPI001C71DA47|nr:uncharacterized protein LOC122279527 [Carya illinoinensis]
MDKSWMQLTDRLLSTQYAEGVQQFISQARNHAVGTNCARCPCRDCYNNIFLPIEEVETHLFINGINPNYHRWIFHGEEEILDVSDEDQTGPHSDEDDYIDDMEQMLGDIREATFMNTQSDNAGPSTQPPMTEANTSFSFDKLLDDARQPLYQGCKQFSKLSFIVKLLHIKTIGGWSIKSFDLLLNLLRSAFPNALLPRSYEESRSLQRGLGFNYHKIHACPNDCVLFWKENADKDECPKCKAPRWLADAQGNRLIPQKVLRHFPLMPRLQRIYMSTKISADMRWHKEQRATNDSVMRHLADSVVWNIFDKDHSWFAEDARNVRLGLASDGFNPFNNLAKPYSIWPPLVDELKELWENGVHTYDAYKKETFTLHAALIWTINGFPAYGNLSGWSTKGKLACPACNASTDSKWLKFGRKHN